MGLLMNFSIHGKVRAIITDCITGETQEFEYENIATNAFLNRIAQWIAGVNNTGQNPAYYPSKFQLGTGSGTPTATDTSLFVPVSKSLISIGAHTNSVNQATISINYPPNVISGTFTEAGLLDANNVLLTHLMLIPPIIIGANQALTLIYDIAITN